MLVLWICYITPAVAWKRIYPSRHFHLEPGLACAFPSLLAVGVHGPYSRIVSLIWGIADDCLRDLYVRGKYREVILPMAVVRCLAAVLEGSKQAVLEMKAMLDGDRRARTGSKSRAS